MAQYSRELVSQEIARQDVLSIIYGLEAQLKAIEIELEKAKKILEPEQMFLYEKRAAEELAAIGKVKSRVANIKGKNAHPGKLLTAVDVADILSVSPATVKAYIKAGKLSGIKLPGGDFRFKPEHLEGWLDKRTLKARSF